MPNYPKQLSAHQVYFKTLNLIFSASKQKIRLVTLEPSMWGLCMPNFSPLTSMVWEEVEVTDRRTGGQTSSILEQIPYKISKLPPCFAWEGLHLKCQTWILTMLERLTWSKYNQFFTQYRMYSILHRFDQLLQLLQLCKLSATCQSKTNCLHEVSMDILKFTKLKMFFENSFILGESVDTAGKTLFFIFLKTKNNFCKVHHLFAHVAT